MSFTFLLGEVTHPLTTWVDCGVKEGERAEVGITEVAARTCARNGGDPGTDEPHSTPGARNGDRHRLIFKPWLAGATI